MEANCVQCGKAIQPDSKFCPYCGKEKPGESVERKCNDCDQEIASDSVFCPNCGKNQNENKQAKTLDLSCKKCGSENVKKLPIAYAEGLANVNLNHAGVGIGIGSGGVGIGVAGGVTNGINQTLLSRNLAPPEISDLNVKLFVVSTILFIISIAFAFNTEFGFAVVAFVASIISSIVAYGIGKNNLIARKQKIKWDNSYLCLRCGEVFISEKEYKNDVIKADNWEEQLYLERQR